jgi:DNA repair protein SbcC/Rad50
VRIVSIHLKNIKSHVDTELSFSPGINVLSGANGSGKSTVFQAIGYALFGVSAQDFVSRAERFLTIGTKRGEVSVVFEPADGELYRVTRTVGPAGKWLLSKSNAGEFEVEEHANIAETEARITKLLGLASGRPLADQFKLVIGPFQNDFLGPFVIRQPTKRQDAFDEILGIDAWRKTFDGTKTLSSTILAKMDTLHAEVAGKQEQVAVLPAKELELRDLTASSLAKRDELALGLQEMERVTALVAACDAEKQRLDNAQYALVGLQERIASGKDHVATQQLLAQQARDAAAALAAARPGKVAYDDAEGRLKLLRIEEQQKFLLEKELAELDKEQSGSVAALGIETRELGDLDAGIETDSQRLEIEEKGQCAALVQLRETEAVAGQALAQVNVSLAQFRELPMHRIENTLPYLLVALDRMTALDSQSVEKRVLLEAGAALRAKAAELGPRQEELERVQNERSELSGRRISLVEGRDKIGAGDCPFFHEPCQNLQDGGGMEVFGSRIEQMDADIALLDGAAQALAVQLKVAQEAERELAGVDQVVRELEQAAREREALELEFTGKFSGIAPRALLEALESFLASAALAGSGLPDLQGPELALAQIPQERRRQLESWSDRWHEVVVALESALDDRVKLAEEPVRGCALKLGELKVRGETLELKKKELAANRARVLQRKQAIQAQQERLQVVREALTKAEAALKVHEGLAQRISAAGEELTRFQKDRDSFLANQKAAEELELRQGTLAKYQARLQELEAELVAKTEELRGFQAAYQAELHEQARKDRERLVSSLATLQAELASLAEGTTRLGGEIAALRVVAGEIAKKLAAVEELREQGALVKFLRNQVFKNVSSQLSERFREEISFRADRIYRSIAESDEELFWGENYQIVLKDMADGVIRERTDDQLSGGQMMSAVVALRLALLQTIGARIAFFDEPTSNLDAERRENLARAFRAIDVGQEEVTEHWYDQLFLVSHDVSFTEITDQTIQLDQPLPRRP